MKENISETGLDDSIILRSQRTEKEIFSLGNAFRALRLDIEAQTLPKPCELVVFGSNVYCTGYAQDIDAFLIVQSRLNGQETDRLYQALRRFIPPDKPLTKNFWQLGKNYDDYYLPLRDDVTNVSLDIVTRKFFEEASQLSFRSYQVKLPRDLSLRPPKPITLVDFEGHTHPIDPRVDHNNNTMILPGFIEINGIPTVPHLYQNILGGTRIVSRMDSPVFEQIQNKCWYTLIEKLLEYFNWNSPEGKIDPKAYLFDPITLFVRKDSFSSHYKDYCRKRYIALLASKEKQLPIYSSPSDPYKYWDSPREKSLWTGDYSVREVDCSSREYFDWNRKEHYLQNPYYENPQEYINSWDRDYRRMIDSLCSAMPHMKNDCAGTNVIAASSLEDVRDITHTIKVLNEKSGLSQKEVETIVLVNGSHFHTAGINTTVQYLRLLHKDTSVQAVGISYPQDFDECYYACIGSAKKIAMDIALKRAFDKNPKTVHSHPFFLTDADITDIDANYWQIILGKFGTDDVPYTVSGNQWWDEQYLSHTPRLRLLLSITQETSSLLAKMYHLGLNPGAATCFSGQGYARVGGFPYALRQGVDQAITDRFDRDPKSQNKLLRVPFQVTTSPRRIKKDSIAFALNSSHKNRHGFNQIFDNANEPDEDISEEIFMQAIQSRISSYLSKWIFPIVKLRDPDCSENEMSSTIAQTFIEIAKKQGLGIMFTEEQVTRSLDTK